MKGCGLVDLRAGMCSSDVAMATWTVIELTTYLKNSLILRSDRSKAAFVALSSGPRGAAADWLLTGL